MAVIQEGRYILTDIVANNNKFWNICLHDDGTVITSWGRVGAAGQSKTFSGGRYFFDSKCREKEGKGYVRSQVIEASAQSAPLMVKGAALADVATQQIRTKNPLVTALVKRLAEWNVHNILNSTTMKYDTSAGTFKTPLGIVTQSAINEARGLLSQIGDFVFARDYDNPQFIRAVNQFLMLVPQNIGMGRLDLRTFYPSVAQVQAQGQILDALEGSLAAVLAAPVDKDKPTVAQEPLFNVQMESVEDGKVIDRLRNKYRQSMNAGHACSHLDVKNIYEVNLANMNRDFEAKGVPIGNVMELFHGTKVGNLLSILKSGLRVSPPASAHVTGKMFGNGVYASDQSTKALNYAYGYWDGTRNDNCFMFILEFAMGKAFTPSGPRGDLPPPGYDSVFAMAGKSGVANNEMIVFKDYQINLKYLMEFSPRGK